jgi:hypothetical protein
MLYTQQLYLGKRHLGTSNRLQVPVHGELQPPNSSAFFCPVCVDVWARAAVLRSDGQMMRAVVWTRPCQKHTGDAYGVSGSLLLPWDRSFNEALPLAALRREVVLHCNDWLKRQGIAV